MNRCLASVIAVVFILLVSHSYADDTRLSVATTYWPPYTDINTPYSPEALVEIVAKVFSKMDQAYDIEEYPWRRCLFNAETGVCDALFAAADTEDRRAYCIYPKEALTSFRYVFFILKNNRNTFRFDTYDDLKKLQIGVIQDAAFTKEPEFIKAASRWGNIQSVVGNLSERQNFIKLDKGRTDCYAGSYSTGMAMIAQLKKEGVIKNEIVPYLDKPIMEKHLYLVFSKQKGYTDSHPLVVQFSNTLAAFKKTNNCGLIFSRYGL